MIFPPTPPAGRGSGGAGGAGEWRGGGLAGIRWGTGNASTKPTAQYEDRKGNARVRRTGESKGKKV